MTLYTALSTTSASVKLDDNDGETVGVLVGDVVGVEVVGDADGDDVGEVVGARAGNVIDLPTKLGRR